MFSGKLLGAMVGLGMGLLMGSATLASLLAVVGVGIGHLLDARSREASSFSLPAHVSLDVPLLLPDDAVKTRAELERESRAYFAAQVAALFQQVAGPSADAGDVRRDAARFLTEKLGFRPEDLVSLLGMNPPPLRSGRDAAALCREELGVTERMLLLDALYALAFERSGPDLVTQSALREMAEALGLSAAERASVASLYTVGEETDYALLGVSPSATDEEVKRAFRHLATLHHPDKVQHLGNTAVFRAGETFRAIREAYESVMDARRA